MDDGITSWRRAASCNNGASCAEVGHGTGVIGVRDSADRDGPVLKFAARKWAEFLAAVKSGAA